MNITIADHNIHFAYNPDLCKRIEERCNIKVIPIPADSAMFRVGTRFIQNPPAICISGNVIADNELSDEICSVINQQRGEWDTLYGYSIIINPLQKIRGDQEVSITVRGVLV